MINKLKQHKLILIIFIIGIILMVTGTTYSFYKIKLEGQKQHIVSSDVIGCSCGALVDGLLTNVLTTDGKQLVKIVAWYDNEMSFTAQLIRTLEYFAKIAK